MAKRKSKRVSTKAKKQSVRRGPAVKMAKGKWVYSFGGGKAEGKPNMRDLLGGKGAGLAEMANLGLPVPPGFTITTEVCTSYYENDHKYPPNLKAQVEKALAQIGRIAGKTLATRPTRCWCRCVPAPARPCRA